MEFFPLDFGQIVPTFLARFSKDGLKNLHFRFTEFTVPEKDQINLDEILSEELLDNELMDGISTAIKCRFVVLSPVAWVPWIKAHLGLKSDMVHVVKDESKIFIRLFSWSESRQVKFCAILFDKN